MIQINRILHPADFSEPSNKAFQYACSLGARFESDLHLIHVCHPLTEAMLSPGAVFPPDFDASRRSWAEEQMSRLMPVDGFSADRMSRHVITGVPFVEIVRYAREQKVDLIVLGTHGRSGLEHVLMGSIAEKVVRKAPCPVLTVRPDGHQFVMP